MQVTRETAAIEIGSGHFASSAGDPPLTEHEWSRCDPLRHAILVVSASAGVAVCGLTAFLCHALAPGLPGTALAVVTGALFAAAAFARPLWSRRYSQVRTARKALERLEAAIEQRLARLAERLTASPDRTPVAPRPSGRPRLNGKDRHALVTALVLERLRTEVLTDGGDHGLVPVHVDRLRSAGIQSIGDLVEAMLTVIRTNDPLWCFPPGMIITGLTTGWDDQRVTIDADTEAAIGAALPEWRTVAQWAVSRYEHEARRVRTDLQLTCAETRGDRSSREDGHSAEPERTLAALLIAVRSIIRFETRCTLDRIRDEQEHPTEASGDSA